MKVVTAKAPFSALVEDENAELGDPVRHEGGGHFVDTLLVPLGDRLADALSVEPGEVGVVDRAQVQAEVTPDELGR